MSGNVEMLELEGKAVAEGLGQALVALVKAEDLADVWRRITTGYSETTPSGGRHLLFRVDGEPLRNTKLARRPATADELAADPDNKLVTLIETRAEGGFPGAPSNGAVHPSGGPGHDDRLLHHDRHRDRRRAGPPSTRCCRQLDQTARTPSDTTAAEPEAQGRAPRP